MSHLSALIVVLGTVTAVTVSNCLDAEGSLSPILNGPPLSEHEVAVQNKTNATVRGKMRRRCCSFLANHAVVLVAAAVGFLAMMCYISLKAHLNGSDHHTRRLAARGSHHCTVGQILL